MHRIRLNIYNAIFIADIHTFIRKCIFRSMYKLLNADCALRYSDDGAKIIADKQFSRKYHKLMNLSCSLLDIRFRRLFRHWHVQLAIAPLPQTHRSLGNINM